MPLKQEMWNNSVNHRTEFQRWIASASSRWTQQQNTTFLHCSAPEADWSLQHSYCHVLFLHIHSWTNAFPLWNRNPAPLCCQPTGTRPQRKKPVGSPQPAATRRLPAPRQHLGQQYPTWPRHPQPPVPRGGAGLGTGRLGDWGTGHSGPSSNRCSSFARFVPEEQLEERALAARCSPTLDVLRSRSWGQSCCQLSEKQGGIGLPQSSHHVGCCCLLAVHSTEGKRHKGQAFLPWCYCSSSSARKPPEQTASALGISRNPLEVCSWTRHKQP